MLSINTRAAVLLGVVGIAAANPGKVKCVDYTDKANQKVTIYIYIPPEVYIYFNIYKTYMNL